MDKYIAANWKMNNDFSDIAPFVKYIKKNAKNEKNLIVCVPSTMIKTFADTAKKLVATGAENCYFEEKGAFTGEISANMVKSAGASYVFVGHSERRQNFGETLEERSKYKSVLKKEIVEGFAGITDFSNIVIAYEPVWAIGTGVVATTADIVKVHKYIKTLVKDTFGADVAVLYGGSVKPSNSKEILALEEVDGVLIGGASLKAEDYIAIAQSR